MNRLKHGYFSSHVRRTTQANRSGHLCCHVGDDVSIQVERHDHVKNLWAICNQSCSDVNDLVVRFNSWILLRDFKKGFVKQAICKLHNVVLGHAGYLFAAVLLGVLKGIANDLFRSWLRNHLQTLVHLLGLAMLNSRIKILFIFADNHQIRFWKMRFDKRRIGLARTNIGIQSKGLTRSHIQRLEASTLRCSDGRFQKNLVGPKRINRIGFHTGTNPFEVHLFSNFDYLVLQLGACSIKDGQGRFHDFRADSVSVGYGNFSFGVHG